MIHSVRHTRITNAVAPRIAITGIGMARWWKHRMPRAMDQKSRTRSVATQGSDAALRGVVAWIDAQLLTTRHALSLPGSAADNRHNRTR